MCASPNPDQPSASAVIGLSCRFPGARDRFEFWRNLLNGTISVAEAPASRWELTPATEAARWGGFIDDVDAFDASFFSIAPREADLMDPQQRILLELTWSCFEDAGIRPSAIAGQDVGVFIGACSFDYKELDDRRGTIPEGRSLTGTAGTFIANRISHAFDLRGPSLAIDTACSSSLVALHLAQQSLLAGECTYALVGGINLLCSPDRFTPLGRLGMLSPTGRCRTFDAAADGYVRGEGAGLVLLATPERARAERRRIHGFITGSAVNHGGRARTLTSPNVFSQARVVAAAHAKAGSLSRTVDYVEAHGTGTPLGDPIEVRGLQRAFGSLPPSAGEEGSPWRCGLGSVKSNIGHLEAAAGIAGVIKVLLSMAHETLPPTPLGTINPKLGLEETPFFVVDAACGWPRRADADGRTLPRRAGVSSFGFGGANAHVVVEDAGAMPSAPASHVPVVVPISARTEAQLRATASALLAFVRRDGRGARVADVAWTLQGGREAMACRAAVICRTVPQLAAGLEQLLHASSVAGALADADADADGDGDGVEALAPADRLRAQEWVSGAEHALPSVNEAQQPVLMPLPTYPFARERHWLPEPPASTATPSAPAPQAFSVAHRLDRSDPAIADHVIRGRVIVPGVQILELARAAAQAALPSARPLHLVDVEWLRPIDVHDRPVDCRIRVSAGEFSVETTADATTWTMCARGRIAASAAGPTTGQVSPAEIRQRCRDRVDHDALYQRLRASGLQYGPRFRAVACVLVNGHEALGELTRTAPPDAPPVDAPTLDGAWQSVMPLIDSAVADRPLLPVSLAAYHYRKPPDPDGFVHARLRESSGGRCRFDVTVLDRYGEVAVIFDGMVVDVGSRAAVLSAFVPHWRTPFAAPALPARRPVAVSGEVAIRQSIVQTLREAGFDAEVFNPNAPQTAADFVWCVAPRIGVSGRSHGDRVNAGPLAFLQWIRLLDERHAFDRKATVRVISAGAFAIAADEVADPYAASVIGIAMALAAERPHVSVTCVDGRVDGDTPAPVSALMSDGPSPVLAWRNGVLLERRLQPVELPHGPLTLRQGLTVVIAGGARGLGLETAVMLAAGAGARIAILGRTAEHELDHAALARIREAGGSHLYCQTDVTDAVSVGNALQRIREAFGPIHGFVQSAMVLRDRPIASIDASDFREAFDGKTVGTQVLIEALAGEPLEFGLLYSSALSFVANAAQANYGAACLFQDACAATPVGQHRVPLQVINWGYWGDVGRVKTPEYRERLERRGIGAIERSEGLDALRDAMRSGLTQVVLFKADPAVLARAGVMDDTSIVRHASACGPGAIARAIVAAETCTADVDEIQREQAGLDELETLACRRVWRRWLASVRGHDGPSIAQVEAALKVAAGRQRLFRAILWLLEERRLIARRGNSLISQASAVGHAERDDLDARWNDFPRSYPALANHHRFVTMCLERLPDVLAGRAPGSELLSDGEAAIEGIYRDAPGVDHSNRLTAAVVAALAVNARADRAVPFRILEVGAGTGATTAAVLAALAQKGVDVEYVYSDVSPHFLRRGRARFVDRYPFLRFETLDLDRSPAAQGFVSGSFDVVIAANVAHATRRIDRVLDRLKWLLKRQGAIVLQELVSVDAFTALTFGLFDGWWQFEDEEARLPHAPLVDLADWPALLGKAGFREVRTETGRPRRKCLAQALVVGASDGVVVTEPEDAITPLVPAVPMVATSSSGDVRALVTGEIRRLAAQLTGLAPEAIDPSLAFADYGVDSLVAVDLIRALGEALGVSIRATAVFDFPTARQLAEHVCGEHAGALSVALGRTVVAVSAPRPAPAGEPSYPCGAMLRNLARPEDVRLEPFDSRPPGDGEVQIGVRAFALNYGDLLCVNGLYPTMPPYPFVPGFEVAGVVVAVGEGVTRFAIGDEVAALTAATLGGHATLVTTREEFVIRKPSRLSFEEASASLVAFLTAQTALDRARLAAGETILVQTAAGGVGLAAVQLARLRGATVVGTAGSDEKCAFLLEIGVAQAINYRREDFAEAISRSRGGVDVVLNTLSGDAVQKGLDLLKAGGRYIEIAVAGLRTARSVDLSRLIDNQTFASLDLRRWLLAHPVDACAPLEQLRRLLDEGRIRPHVDRVFPLSALPDAYAQLQNRANKGKVVVSVPHHAGTPVVAAQRQVPTLKASGDREAIAIIGMSGRFPGAPDLETFWRNLADGVCSVGPLPADRHDGSGERGRRVGGFLSGIDCFDPLFFNISGREAESMDPQQRLFLEECWKAFEDAAVTPADVDGSRCGVFLGAGAGDYHQTLTAAGADRAAHAFMGNEVSIGAARIAYCLNLKGPTMAIGTACSSSLVALHQAAQSLRAGECDLALAGGVFVNTTTEFHDRCTRAGMLSPRGCCSAFDDAADGFVPGEGVGVVVLKRLADALAAGDHVHGVMIGSGINQDGRTNGITAPSVRSQTDLEAEVYRRANVSAGTIGYVECHGTGTALGDPIEIEALTASFRQSTDRRGFCRLGSVKNNIGHAVTAAGIAGVLKVLLAFRHRQLPPLAGFQSVNARIDLGASPFVIDREARPWGDAGGIRRAAVSSFGFSGTNAHLLLEEAPRVDEDATPARSAYLFAVSARTEAALRRRLEDLDRWLDTHTTSSRPIDVSFTLARGRAHFAHRVAFVASDLTSLQVRIRTFLAGPAGDVPHQVAALAEDAGCPIALIPSPGGQEPASYSDRLLGVARVYVSGHSLDWAAAAGERPRRIPLPVYSFERERYWPGHATAAPPDSRIQLQLVPGDEANTWSVGIDPKAAWLHDHEVDGRAILPAAVLLELARAAAGQTAGRAAALSGIAWLRPLEVPADLAHLRVALTMGAAESRIEITTRARRSIRHMTATVSAPDRHPPLGVVDLEAVRRRCVQTVTTEECRRNLQRRGIRHGATYDGLRAVRIGSSEVLAELRLPDDVRAETARSWQGAQVIDCAWQALAAVDQAGEAAAVAVPFALERVEWAGDPHAVRWGHIVVTSGSLRDSHRTFDVVLADEAGQVVCRMSGLAVHDIPRQRAVTAGAVVPFDTVWQPEALTPGEGPRSIVLFDMPHDVADALISLCAGPGTVVARADVEALTRGLHRETAKPQAIVIGSAAFESATDVDAVALLRPLVNAFPSGGRLLFVARGDATGVQAMLPAIAASLRVLTAEQPQWAGQVLELVDAAPASSVAHAIIAELAAPSPVAREVRVAGSQRLVRRLERSTFRSTPIAIRPDGVYLVSGGGGRIGRALAEHLAARGATVVLAGRSCVSAELEAWLGGPRPGAIVYERTDVSDATATRRLVERVTARFGALHGVIHAAGVLDDHLISDLEPARLRVVADPKVRGARHLDEAIGDRPIDFFLMCSSLAALAGGPGQAAYSAANGYLDGFAEWREGRRRAGQRTGVTASIGWPLWADGAMQPPERVKAAWADAFGLQPLPTDEALTAFDALLERGGAGRVVFFGDPRRASAIGERMSRVADADETADGSVDVHAGRGEQVIVDLLHDALRIAKDRLPVTEPFDRYGLDSIMAVELTERLEHRFGPLPKTLFFEHPTIRQLGRHLSRQYPDAFRATDVTLAPSTAIVVPRAAAGPDRAASGDIAIIGLAGRYPASPDLAAFWDNLRAGRDCVTRVSRDGWSSAGDADGDRPWAGLVDGYDRFDSLFFNISPREARLIDPQERLFLETAWAAIEDAGHTREALRELYDRRVAVFAGVMWGDYQLHSVEERHEAGARQYVSSFASIANRVSYVLDLRGPSMAVDTMCSSSLTCLYLACDSLRNGSARLAIAGGVNLCLHPHKYQYLAQEQFLSSDGRCRSFGEGGDGYVPGEGVGAVLLKPLQAALADGDHIHAVIKGIGVNHGGRAYGYTVPTAGAQADLITEVMTSSGVAADTLGYVEAHGTGTSLGDPIELRALAAAFGTVAADDAPCAIGSVKSNIGHLESAAGIAALTKTILQMQHGQLVPSLHAERLNPSLSFDGSPFRIQRRLEAWPRATDPGSNRPLPRRAAISSFGAGGANAHLILEEAPAAPARAMVSTPQLLPLSARTRERLCAYAASMVQAFAGRPADNRPPLADVALTLQVGREPLEARMAVVAATWEEWLAALRAFAAQDEAGNAVHGQAPPGEPVVRVDEDRVAALAAQGDVMALARAWVCGGAENLPWHLVHDGAARRVSLPTYPFAAERHWAPRPAMPSRSSVGPAPASVRAATVTTDPIREVVRKLQRGAFDVEQAVAVIDELAGERTVRPPSRGRS